MKYTTDEMISALQVIKGVCEEQDNLCHHCPFWSEVNGCGISWGYPSEWDIVKPTDKLLK